MPAQDTADSMADSSRAQLASVLHSFWIVLLLLQRFSFFLSVSLPIYLVAQR